MDPNRVLDLILDTMEHQLWNLSFLLLLKDFRKSSITHILGFKFTQFKTTDEKPGESSPSSPFSFHNPTPQTLYALAALLLTVGLISLDELLPYFSPSFQDFKVIINEKSSKLQDEIKSYGVVNLTKKSEAKSATASIVNAVDSTSPSSLAYADGYQLIGLLAATITVRNWGLAQELIQLIKVHTGT